MPEKKLADRLREALRLRGYSIRTEKAYVDWIRRYILFHNKRHPAEMGNAEVEAFLTHLAVDQEVAALPPEPGPLRPPHSSTEKCSSKTPVPLMPCAPRSTNASLPF